MIEYEEPTMSWMSAGWRHENFWPRDREWVVTEFSLIQRLNSLLESPHYRERVLREIAEGSTMYHVETASDLFRAVLTIDIDLHALLDKYGIKRKVEGWKYFKIFGPPPQSWGPAPQPPEEMRLVQVLPSPRQKRELTVQPLAAPVGFLPVLTSVFPDYMATLKELVEAAPLKPSKEFVMKPASVESFTKVGNMINEHYRRQGFPVDDQ
jgi:hypothetical protein